MEIGTRVIAIRDADVEIARRHEHIDQTVTALRAMLAAGTTVPNRY